MANKQVKNLANSMEVVKYPDQADWRNLLRRPLLDHTELYPLVSRILEQVQMNGDNAVKQFNLEFDKAEIENLRVSQDEISEALQSVDHSLKKAIEVAKQNIERFHSQQKFTGKVIETTPGVRCWQKAIPVEKVGLYIPGGSAPLFSTVLMLGIPAKLAGCRRIVLCTPPSAEGKIHPAILYAAHLTGIEEIYKVGGVQAIGAMAYGTETIPSVYKIFGPGNQYVSAAKELVNREGIAIDMVAGPSEVAVMADETSNPSFIASDLLSQAEHGPDSQVLLISTSEKVVEGVLDEVDKQLEVLPRKEIAAMALRNSKLVVVNNQDQMVEMINSYAPEHLIIVTKNYQELAGRIVNAGSVFLGKYTPESAGDYASGTNHTLPTNGHAKVTGGVSQDSFIKKVTFQEISEYGIFNIGAAIESMAEAEQLQAHRNAVSIRLKDVFENLK